MKIKNIFDWVGQMSYYKQPWSSFTLEEQEMFNNFMINRIISMNPNYIEVVAEIQDLPLPKDKLYKFYVQNLPKQKFFNKYIKPSKSQYSKELLISLSNYFQTSTREIIDYCKILNKIDIIDILRQLGNEDKIIKNLLK